MFFCGCCSQILSQLRGIKRPTEITCSWVLTSRMISWRSSCNNLIVSSLTYAAMESGLELKFFCKRQPVESKCNVPLQVRGGLCRNILRPHHAVPAAGERRGGRHLPGGQDDQSHEARSFHWHGEFSVIMSTGVFSPLWSSPLLILKIGLSALTH